MDTRRNPPKTGAPARNALVKQVYDRNLRPVVTFTAGLSAGWTLLYAISEFRDVSGDKHSQSPKFATYSIVLGVMYISVCAIEILGITAAMMQRLALIRIYALASVLSCVTAIAASMMEVVIHFTAKNDIISECTTLATGEEISYNFGWFGPSSSETLNSTEAASFCNDGYTHDSWSDIVILLATIVFSVLFSMLAFAYYRQMMDPTSAVNSFRIPSNQARRGNASHPDHYNPPYDSTGLPNLGYGSGPSAYAPPAGAPPGFGGAGYSTDDLKPPGYGDGDHDDHYGYGSKYGTDKDLKGDDPFADHHYDGDVKDEERDVTTGPKPGEHDEFHI